MYVATYGSTGGKTRSGKLGSGIAGTPPPPHFVLMDLDDCVGSWKVCYDWLGLSLSGFVHPSCPVDTIALSGGVGNELRRIRLVDTVSVKQLIKYMHSCFGYFLPLSAIALSAWMIDCGIGRILN